MKIRNPNATCGNCPYWARNPYNETIGECRIDPRGRCTGGDYPDVYTQGWCRQHPDFWANEEAPRPDPEEWFPADYAPPKWETVICGNGKEIYAGFRSEAVWYRMGFNGTYPCVAPKRWKPLPKGCADPGVLAMQALAETDGQEDDSWKYHTCRECKHRGSMCGCGRFYLGRTLEFIPDKNNCPAFEEGDPKEGES